MFQIERQDKILQYINKKKKANIKELSDVFEVSKVTIRRDLDELAGKGLIIKTHGGVMSIMNKLSFEIPYKSKSEVNSEQKKKIGIAAAELIEDGDIIILDSGSTTLEVAKNIKGKNITVLTNDLKVSMEVAQNPNAKLIVAGGSLNESVYTLTGSQTVETFKKVHVNKTFLGCDALDLAYGLTNRTMHEVDVKKSMIEAADEVILVTDSSKFGKRVFTFLCDTSEIDKLITDQIDDQLKTALESQDVEVIIAK
jgi:DeoR/GlpR family transcriptional regulator of sugar metabolism